MKPKLFSLLFAIVASVGTMFANGTKIGDLYYNLNETDKTAEVTYELQWDYNNYKGLTTANIPASVTYSGKTYSVTSIGNMAFARCSGLTSVTIPNSVTSIGGSAFYGCSGLTSVTIPNSVTSIGNSVFLGCSGLTSVTIPNSVTSIEGSAFHDCSGLTSVTIPNSVTSIGEYAFYDCRGLTSVTIPNSVTSIGVGAFSDCSGLASVTIPNSVTSIGDGAFADCTNLASIVWNAKRCNDFSPDVTPFNIYNSLPPAEQITSFTFGEEVEVIPAYICDGMTKLTSVTIPNSVTSIGDGAFADCGNIKSIVWNAKNCNGYKFGSQVESFVFGDRVEVIPANLCSGMTKLTSITIPNSVTSIGSSAFYNCNSLTSVTIPNSVTSIGNNAFCGCTGLTSVTIPNSVTYIGLAVFNGCSGLTSVVIPESVASIGQGATFVNCTSLQSVQWNAKKCKIEQLDNGNYSPPFYNLSNITTFTFGNNVETIPDYLCGGLSGLSSISAPNSVTSIGDYAFYGCNGLTSATIPNSVTSIGDYAFYGCNGLTSATIPNSVTSIGIGAFYGCSSITSVVIPESVASIGQGATFGNCTSLQSVQWNAKKCTIEKNKSGSYYPPFHNLSNITTFTFGNNVENIPECLCIGLSGLSSISAPNSVTSIGDYAFYGCNGLTSATIPNSVTSIGVKAFYDCNNLISANIEPITPPAIGINVFANCSALKAINVPCESYEAYTTADNWSTYSSIINPPLYTIAAKESANGYVSIPSHLTSCDANVQISANPNYGYHFSQWADGNTNNPRVIAWTQDTIVEAIFAINQYSINVSCDDKQGSVVGENGSFDYLTEKTYEATPNYGYHFARWSDREYVCDDYWNDYCWYGHWEDITTPQRTVTITQDTVITAIFEPNIYTVSPMVNTWGSISGTGQFAYLTECTITANPNYGYHFVRWSDGETANPRMFILTQDTIFAAEYAIDKSGTCGDNLALRWEYDTNGKVLTISGSGTLNSNYLFGVEAPDAMEKLVIAEGVTTIGNSAFAGFETIKHISIPASVKTVYEQAFYNCTGLQEIYSYRDKPSVAYSNSFDGIDKFECTLHVLSASVDMYKSATGWRDFYYIQTIDAEAVTEPIEDVSVTPSVTTAAIAWPAVENAATYELTIKDKNGNVVCTLVFNAQGQLTSIAFAAPSRSQQSTQAAGFSFTVTGLDSSSKYGFTLDAKDSNGNIIDTKSGSFETTSDISTGINNLDATIAPVKFFRNGQLFILRGDKTYTVQGQEVR